MSDLKLLQVFQTALNKENSNFLSHDLLCIYEDKHFVSYYLLDSS